MSRRKIALRSFRDLCTFIGAIVLFSYFYNFSVDTRHWLFTVASAFGCSILWLGFYMFEAHKDTVTEVLLSLKRVVLKSLSPERTKPSESPLSGTIEPEEKLIT